MRRKIIKQGHGTLTITLPMEWVKKYNLNVGDEVDVSERENGLHVCTERHDGVRRTEIDISGLDIPTIWKFFMSAYREGYDEVSVHFNPDDIYDNPYQHFTAHSLDPAYSVKERQHTPSEAVQKIANRFIGFEVIEHQRNKCIVKNMAEITSKEFDSSLRRVFLLLRQMSDELKDAMQKDNPSIVGHMHDIDLNVDKFHDYCVRVLNKTCCRDTRKSHVLFSTLFLLELLGDEYKHITRHMFDLKKGFSSIGELAQMLSSHFDSYYELFYHFENSKAVGLSKSDMDIYSHIRKLFAHLQHTKKLCPNHIQIIDHYRRIARYINALVELRIELAYTDEKFDPLAGLPSSVATIKV